MRLTAEHLVEALKLRHMNDFALDQVKTGPTWYSTGTGILDFWAMKKSWTDPQTVGYEIKVDRSDFLADQKWMNYLPFCSYFYFVCAPGVCDKSEIPEQCGLLVSSQTGSRLYQKKKAHYRKIEAEDLEMVFRYILMSRVRVRDEYAFDRGGDAKAFLEAKTERKAMGTRVSRKIGALVEQRVADIEEESRRIKAENEDLTKFKEALDSLGIPLGSFRWQAEQRVKRVLNFFEDHEFQQVVRRIKKARDETRGAAEVVDALVERYSQEHGNASEGSSSRTSSQHSE
tara:strand:+ start:1329 stop:2186 length:858 start_codon:yes stop_codon:yes gene_type:complete